jgi:hypothetical protein
MKSGNETVTKPEGSAASQGPGAGARDEVRELSEALSLYRSAMHHVAEKQATKPWSAIRAEQRPARTLRMRLVLVPALAAGLAVAVIAPAWSHLHPGQGSAPKPAAHVVQPAPQENLASVDDTELMNQIEGDLSTDVPDALQPLADLGDTTTSTTTSSSEKKNVTQE